MKIEEKTIITLVLGIIALAFLGWAFSSLGIGLDHFCSPDFLGGCN